VSEREIGRKREREREREIGTKRMGERESDIGIKRDKGERKR